MKRAVEEKLEAILKEQVDIETHLSSPAGVANRAEYSKQAKRIARLKRLTGPYLRFKELRQELDRTREMISKPGQEVELIALAKEEIQRLGEKLPAMERELEDLLITSDEDPDRTVIVEVRAGTGGEEASLFA